MIPEPKAVHRSWTFIYERPRQMGWPLLTRTAYTIGRGERPAARIIPKRLRIVVRCHPGKPPFVDAVSVTGNWMSSGKEAIGIRVLHDSEPGSHGQVYADDTVYELMADAIRRATAEIVILVQP